LLTYLLNFLATFFQFAFLNKTIRKSKKDRQHKGQKKNDKRTNNDLEVEVEDTKEVIRIRLSKKDRQHNGQKKNDKRTNNDLQSRHIKLNIE